MIKFIILLTILSVNSFSSQVFCLSGKLVNLDDNSIRKTMKCDIVQKLSLDNAEAFLKCNFDGIQKSIITSNLTIGTDFSYFWTKYHFSNRRYHQLGYFLKSNLGLGKVTSTPVIEILYSSDSAELKEESIFIQEENGVVSEFMMKVTNAKCEKNSRK